MRGLDDFLAYMRSAYPSEVLTISQEIDPAECDHAALETYFSEQGRFPWLIFPKARTLNGKPWHGLFANNHLNNYRNFGLAFGLDLGKQRPFDLIRVIHQGLNNPVQPETIRGGVPVKQRIVREPDFGDLPLWRNCEDDSRPGWLSPIVIARDPETGRYNYSWHRFSYNGPNNATLRFYPGRQLYDYWMKYRAMNQPMPVALVVGHHAAFSIACATKYELDKDETCHVAGIYQQGTKERLRLCPSETWGEELMIPADAEIVIEGYVYDRYDFEGPYSDWFWTYAPQYYHPTFEATVINQKETPIVEAYWPKTHVIHYPALISNIYDSVRKYFPDIRSINYLPCLVAIVSFKPNKKGQAKNLGHSLFQLGDYIKLVIVVDDDIDPYNLTEVLYALGTRVDARKDVTIVEVEGTNMDPSTIGGIAGGMVIDATKPVGEPFPKIGVPPKEKIEQWEKLLRSSDLSHVSVFSKWGW